MAELWGARLNPRQWGMVLDRYYAAQRRKQREYQQKTGDNAPWETLMPNRDLSGWDDGVPGKRKYVVRNVDRVLMRISEDSLRKEEFLSRFS